MKTLSVFGINNFCRASCVEPATSGVIQNTSGAIALSLDRIKNSKEQQVKTDGRHALVNGVILASLSG